MSIYEASITNPKKQLEFYKDLSEQLQRENKQLHEELEWAIGIVEHNRIIGEKNKEIHQLKEKLDCDLQWALKYEKQVGNWNKLKWYIMKKDCHNETFTYLELIEKMKELERGVSDVED